MDIRVGWGLLDARINLINLNLECGQFAGEGESKNRLRGSDFFPGDDHTHTHSNANFHTSFYLALICTVSPWVKSRYSSRREYRMNLE